MLRCREISKLVSQSMEQNLPLRQRISVRMHLMMCRLCAGFSRQVRLFRRAAHEHPERFEPPPAAPDAELGPEARERIKSAMRSDGE